MEELRNKMAGGGGFKQWGGGGEGWSERGRGVSYIGIRERGVKNWFGENKKDKNEKTNELDCEIYY